MAYDDIQSSEEPDKPEAIDPIEDGDKDDTITSSKEWEDTHETAMEEYERAWDRERNNQDEAYEDLRFRRGRREDQWTPEALQQRGNRPAQVINLLPKFIRQVTGDLRKMRPSIKVVPVDSKGDQDTAEILGGMIRYIENRSYAKHIYTTAADSQVCCGIGHWQVETEYAHAGTFNQEIRITGIEDGVAVLWDADATMPTREDADHCFVPIDMTLAAFKKRWKDAKAESFDVRSSAAFSNWSSDDYIRVVAYWKKKPLKRTLALLPDGTVEDLTEQLETAAPELVQQVMAHLKGQGVRVEERDSYEICRYLMTQAEILEEKEWPGMHIPIIPALGEEIRIGREVYRHGIVRYARDLQRMVNYYSSAETEVVALQPKAPWIVTKKMVEKYYDQWESANTDNLPFLEYDVDPSAPGSKPERIAPPVASQGIQAGSIKAAEDMKAVIGIYDAALGAKSNETSGVAIRQRDEQADTGTFVYIDNFNMAIQRTGQIINELIPKVYDTQRMMRIIGDDGKPSLEEINKPEMTAQGEKIKNDVTVGSYDVMMESGPGFATKREAAQAGLTEFIRAFPQAAPLLGDIYAKIMDFPHAEEIGERLEEALPPQIKSKLQEERQKAEADPNAPPPPATPQQQQAMQAQQMQQHGVALEMADKEADIKKKNAETAKILKEAGMAPGADQASAMQAQADAHLQAIEIASKEDELQTKRAINALNVQIKQAELERARNMIGQTSEKHDISMIKDGIGIGHMTDKHHADMTVQTIGAHQGHEKHQANMANAQNKYNALQQESAP